jgi:hypothetical protein
MSSKALAAVSKVYAECGITSPFEIPLETIISSRNIIIREEVLEGAEARILMNENSGIITIDNRIYPSTKKRFILAHELGHFELHRNLIRGFNDTDETINHWYQYNLKSEEIEANEFAAEFLMPAELFRNECKGKIFDHRVIEHLSNYFKVSKTAAILKFVKENNGNHPIFVVCCQNNVMKWFKKSDDFYHYSLFSRNLPPPSGSVAFDIFDKGSAYYGEEQTQQIWKSDWFETKDNEKDTIFFEYCLYVKSYNYTLSVIWEK